MPSSKEPILWVNNLRSFLISLVIVVHVAMAYNPQGRQDENTYIKSSHAIIDTKKLDFVYKIVDSGDIFLMPLMFLISGLFVVPSLKRKGRRSFLRDRFGRMFPHFLFVGTFLSLIAYFPAYYKVTNHSEVDQYIFDFFSQQHWPIGPAWFLWVLLVFNLITIPIYTWLKPALSKGMKFLLHVRSKLWAFGLWVVFTSLLFGPLAVNFGIANWQIIVGPFDLQVSRIPLYFAYYFVGLIIGQADFNDTFFISSTFIVRKWWLSLLVGCVFLILLTISPNWLYKKVVEGEFTKLQSWSYYFLLWTSFCASSCIGLLGLFKRHFNYSNALWRNFSENSYLIYLIHFPVVIWIQYFFLKLKIDASMKFLLGSILSIGLTWTLSWGLRKSRIIRDFF